MSGLRSRKAEAKNSKLKLLSASVSANMATRTTNNQIVGTNLKSTEKNVIAVDLTSSWKSLK